MQPRLETLGDWGRLTAPFFADEIALDVADLQLKGKSKEELADILQMAVWKLEPLRDFSADRIEAVFRELAEKLDVKLRDLNLPFYVALSGGRVWTPLYDSMAILGSDMTRVRLRRAIDALGGISEKRLKKLEKEFAERFASET